MKAKAFIYEEMAAAARKMRRVKAALGDDCGVNVIDLTPALIAA